jgi:hypothetical protein
MRMSVGLSLLAKVLLSFLKKKQKTFNPYSRECLHVKCRIKIELPRRGENLRENILNECGGCCTVQVVLFYIVKCGAT